MLQFKDLKIGERFTLAIDPAKTAWIKTSSMGYADVSKMSFTNVISSIYVKIKRIYNHV